MTQSQHSYKAGAWPANAPGSGVQSLTEADVGLLLLHLGPLILREEHVGRKRALLQMGNARQGKVRSKRVWEGQSRPF